MTIASRALLGCVCLLAAAPGAAHAQIVEALGTRAQGMAGAFVAVANDSSATWWNPAGLAEGPFLDMALGRAATETTGSLPSARDRTSWFALGTPPFGFSYYRLRITDIQPLKPTGRPPGDREDGWAGVPVRSLVASQLGATLLRTLVPGVHVGTTLKYVRGTLRSDRADSAAPAADLLDYGAALEDGDAENAFDLDLGVLARAGPVRLGAVVRNVTAPGFGADAYRLPRQARVGVAYDAAAAGGPGLTVAFDADVRTYTSGAGDRRVLAFGAEQWLLARRLGVRGGLRANTVGGEERSGTAGVSVAPRAGLYLDGYVVRGGAEDERGWGITARVSF